MADATQAKRIVYKALNDKGESPHQRWAWPLPQDDKKPGKWVKVDGPPKLCQHGFHGYHTLEKAKVEPGITKVYEMEVAGEVVEDDHKLAATKARLVRLAWDGSPPLPPAQPRWTAYRHHSGCVYHGSFVSFEAPDSGAAINVLTDKIAAGAPWRVFQPDEIVVLKSDKADALHLVKINVTVEAERVGDAPV